MPGHNRQRVLERSADVFRVNNQIFTHIQLCVRYARFSKFTACTLPLFSINRCANLDRGGLITRIPTGNYTRKITMIIIISPVALRAACTWNDAVDELSTDSVWMLSRDNWNSRQHNIIIYRIDRNKRISTGTSAWKIEYKRGVVQWVIVSNLHGLGFNGGAWRQSVVVGNTNVTHFPFI